MSQRTLTWPSHKPEGSSSSVMEAIHCKRYVIEPVVGVIRMDLDPGKAQSVHAAFTLEWECGYHYRAIGCTGWRGGG